MSVAPPPPPKTPTEWLLEAIRQIPALVYAIGVVGLVAAAAISMGFVLGRWEYALFGGIAVFGGMVLVRIYVAVQPRKVKFNPSAPFAVLVWAFVVAVVAVLGMGVIKLGFNLFAEGRPKNGAGNPPSNGPQSMKGLVLSLLPPNLNRAGETPLATTEIKQDSTSDLIDAGAIWAKNKLDSVFPPSTDTTIGFVVGINKDNMVYTEPPDKYRQVRFWLFAREDGSAYGTKIGHFTVEDQKEEIAREIGWHKNDPEAKLIMHAYKPRFELELIRLPLRECSEPVTLKERKGPLRIVLKVEGRKEAVERLREKLTESGLAVTTESLVDKSYYESKEKGDLSPEARLGLLREARVDAVLSGAFDSE